MGENIRKKVFCDNCMWLLNYYGAVYKCYTPENITDTWKKKDGKFLKLPSELNSDNHCKYFIPKPEKITLWDWLCGKREGNRNEFGV